MILSLGLILAACERSPDSLQPTPVSLPPSVARNQSTALSSPWATLTPTPAPIPSATLTPSATLAAPSPTPLRTKAPWLAEIRYEPWDLVMAVAWSPGGEWLAATAGNNLYVYEAASFRQVHRMLLKAWAEGLAFNPLERGQLALASRDGSLQVWDVDKGQLLAYWLAHPRGARSVAFSPLDGLLASAGSDAFVRLWRLDEPGGLEPEQPPPSVEMIGGAFAVPAICFSPDGRLVASIDGNDIRLRDPATQRLVRTLRSGYPNFSLAFSPDGRWLAAAEIGYVVRLWDIESGEVALELFADEGRAADSRQFFWAAAFSPDGRRVAAAGSDGWITVWEVPSRAVLAHWRAHDRAATSVAFSPDGRLASGGLDAAVRVWQID